MEAGSAPGRALLTKSAGGATSVANPNTLNPCFKMLSCCCAKTSEPEATSAARAISPANALLPTPGPARSAQIVQNIFLSEKCCWLRGHVLTYYDQNGTKPPAQTRQETLVMAKTPSPPRARGKSKPAKAAAASRGASRAKRGPHGSDPQPKAAPTKTAARRNEAPALKAAAAPKARASTPASKGRRSAPQREAEPRQAPE